MELEPVIGLEIHVQLKTATKMFCRCSNLTDTAAPNSSVCPICMGHPGTLPVPNQQAIQLGIKAGRAIACTIPDTCKFDRKHYFYPDLPKGYQISQFDQPLAIEGAVTIETPDGTHTIRIERAHLEEDAAKNTHTSDGATLVDYNRAGAPLVEIVTRPDFRSPAEAKQFLQELRLILRTVGASEANMEKGQMRCDANISLRLKGTTEFHSKTEVKNINSFRAVERALEYEIDRQSKLWHTNTPPNQTTTRGWDDVKQETVMQRTKEGAHDYRFFPEPDIPPIITTELFHAVTMPELPAAKRTRFVQEYCFKPSDIAILIDSAELAAFAEQVMSESYEWLESLPEVTGTFDEIKEQHGSTLGKLVGGWITTKLLGTLADKGMTLERARVTPENFAELMSMVFTKRVNSTVAYKILDAMVTRGIDPTHFMEEEGIEKGISGDAIHTTINNVIATQPDAVEKYKAGKIKLIEFLVGLAMRELKGNANPEEIREIMKKELGG